jgi:hypothetical protein
MTNPNTPQQPQGTGPVQGEPQQQPPFAPQQPYGPPAGYPQQPYPAQGQPSQPAYAPPGQAPQQPYSASYPQPPQVFPPERPAPPARPARPKTDPNGVPYGVGPFTLREAVFLGAAALVFLASFLPFLGGDYADVFGYASAWAPAPWLVVPAALVLVAAAALIVARRVGQARRLSVGSLSIDQFASAASVVTAGFYLGTLFLIIGFPAWFGGGSDILEPGAGVIVGLLFSLLAVAVTTVAPRIPLFAGDFANRHEVGAHPIARPATAVPRRPRAQRPAAPLQPAPYPGQPGVHMQQAGPGEFAAYQRRGSQPAPLPVDDAGTAPFFPAPTAGAAVGAVAYQPQQAAPTSLEPAVQGSDVGSAARDADPVAQPVAEPVAAQQPEAPSSDEPPAVAVDSAAVSQPDVELPSADTTTADPSDIAEVEGTRALPTDTVDEPQAFAPGFVATDVPAVDPQGVAAVPIDEYRRDEDLRDEDSDDTASTGAVEPAPVSAFTHVSARTAAGAANVAAASGGAFDDSGPIAEAPTAVFSTQPFWVYSPVPRPVVDEVSGATVFEIGPTAWALAIIDRGSELVIRHDDGRVGVLQNLEGITRG